MIKLLPITVIISVLFIYLPVSDHVPLLIIEENWHLNRINFNLTAIEAGDNILIRIANNPRLTLDEKLLKLLREKANNGSYIRADGRFFY